MGRHRANNAAAARLLRSPLTESEAILWEQLRSRKLAGFKFRRQHPVGPYVLDFFCASAKLAVEVDGGVHRTPEQSRSDRDRQRTLEELGVHFVRFSVEDMLVNLEGVLTTLAAAATRLEKATARDAERHGPGSD